MTLNLFLIFTLSALIIYLILQSNATAQTAHTINDRKSAVMDNKPENFPTAVFAGGCFWCIESEFRRIEGVLFTRSGYTGGHLNNPRYEDTHDSKSGHAEAVEVTYDPNITHFEALAEFFLTQAHDPTQLNRQGPDVGTQYRSAIFHQNEAEKNIAQKIIDKINNQHLYSAPIVTTLEPRATFWEAEDYHQQYYEKYEKKYGQPHINDWLKRQRRK